MSDHLNRAIEALYACAREHGEALNLSLKVKYIEETRGMNIGVNWEYLGDPENPQDDDTLVATFFLEEMK